MKTVFIPFIFVFLISGGLPASAGEKPFLEITVGRCRLVLVKVSSGTVRPRGRFAGRESLVAHVDLSRYRRAAGHVRSSLRHGLPGVDNLPRYLWLR